MEGGGLGVGAGGAARVAEGEGVERVGRVVVVVDMVGLVVEVGLGAEGY